MLASLNSNGVKFITIERKQNEHDTPTLFNLHQERTCYIH
jgi:hypothetical protein